MPLTFPYTNTAAVRHKEDCFWLCKFLAHVFYFNRLSATCVLRWPSHSSVMTQWRSSPGSAGAGQCIVETYHTIYQFYRNKLIWFVKSFERKVIHHIINLTFFYNHRNTFNLSSTSSSVTKSIIGNIIHPRQNDIFSILQTDRKH